MSKRASHQAHPCRDVGRFLDRAFDRLELDAPTRQLLRQPHREVQFELPLVRADGSVRVFRGFRVQHDRSRGPFKGGLRYHPEVDIDHFRALASVMSWKTACVDLPFGGGKGGINCDPHDLSERELEMLTKRYVERLDGLLGPDQDIIAPDMGTGPEVMAWVLDAYSKRHGFEPAVVTGKPLQLGGSPGRLEATGRGVALVTAWAAEDQGVDIEGARVAIQGFGNVGSHAGEYLVERGAKLVAVSGAKGGIHEPEGLDTHALIDAVRERPKTSVTELGLNGEPISNEELLALDVNVLIPAAVAGAIHADNVDTIRAELIIEGANIPITAAAHERLVDRGVRVIPDILANAGGVSVSYLEWVQNRNRYGWDLERVNGELEDRLWTAWTTVRNRARAEEIDERLAAYCVAIERTLAAIELRGF